MALEEEAGANSGRITQTAGKMPAQEETITMMISINIKRIGYHIGTSGWLRAGITDGSITIQEGLSKTGKLGLWLHAEGEVLCLAIRDPYDYDGLYIACWLESARNADSDPSATHDKIGVTSAVREALHSLSEEWVAEQSNALETDSPIHLTAVYAAQ